MKTSASQPSAGASRGGAHGTRAAAAAGSAAAAEPYGRHAPYMKAWDPEDQVKGLRELSQEMGLGGGKKMKYLKRNIASRALRGHESLFRGRMLFFRRRCRVEEKTREAAEPHESQWLISAQAARPSASRTSPRPSWSSA